MHDRSTCPNAVPAPAVPACGDTPTPELAMIQSEIARVDAAEEVDAFVCPECHKPIPVPQRARAYVYGGRAFHGPCAIAFRLTQLEQDHDTLRTRVDGLSSFLGAR